MNTRTPLLFKLFKLLVIGVVFLVTLHKLIRQMSTTESVKFAQSLFHMDDKGTYALGITNRNLSNSKNPGTFPIGKLRLNSRIKPRMYVRRSTMYEKAAFY